MFHRLQRRMRNVVAMCCMALMTVVVAQAAVMTLDRAQHAFGAEHPPTALAGQVHLDHDHDHDEVAAPVADSAELGYGESGSSDDGRLAHHHASEAPHLATLDGDGAQYVLLPRMISPQTTELDGLPQLVVSRLERPPKAHSKTIA